MLPVLAGTLLFVTFVLAFRTFGSRRPESNWKRVTETSVMILFITWVVFYAGKIASPLLNLYLLPVIASALILGKLMTFIEMVAIAGRMEHAVTESARGSRPAGSGCEPNPN